MSTVYEADVEATPRRSRSNSSEEGYDSGSGTDHDDHMVDPEATPRLSSGPTKRKKVVNKRPSMVRPGSMDFLPTPRKEISTLAR